jgi:predicted RNase H-like HicB family nuclease
LRHSFILIACWRKPLAYLRDRAAPFKIVVERHPNGYVAYPVGLGLGVIVGHGDSYEEALAHVRSAIAFHVETFGPESAFA